MIGQAVWGLDLELRSHIQESCDQSGWLRGVGRIPNGDVFNNLIHRFEEALKYTGSPATEQEGAAPMGRVGS
jgi:hypothetical protein